MYINRDVYIDIDTDSASLTSNLMMLTKAFLGLVSIKGNYNISVYICIRKMYEKN